MAGGIFQAQLLDKDTMTLLAGQLTREQAGRKLARLCKAGAEFVRAADKRESELVAANALGALHLAQGPADVEP